MPDPTAHNSEPVITAMGVVSPIGIGTGDFCAALRQRRSGISRMEGCAVSTLPVQFSAEIKAFDPKPYVKVRKSLKIMARDTTLGLAAAALAFRATKLEPGEVDPRRLGVVLGADPICPPMEEATQTFLGSVIDGRFDFQHWATVGAPSGFPLSLLRLLPNMIPAHVSIAFDAQGPNNAIHHGDVSSLGALSEAGRIIRRGAADVIIAGGASSQMSHVDWIRHCVLGGLAHRCDAPEAAMRPFDADRDGTVWGEGAACFVVEARHHAEARGAPILARLAGWASACEPATLGHSPSGKSIETVIRAAMRAADLEPGQVGHVNAHGLGTPQHDRIEAQAIRRTLGDVPVTAPKSYFGNLGAAGGAVELAASLLGLSRGTAPVTLNYRRPDPQCPINVIHDHDPTGLAPTCVTLNWTWQGQAAAVALRAD